MLKKLEMVWSWAAQMNMQSPFKEGEKSHVLLLLDHMWPLPPWLRICHMQIILLKIREYLKREQKSYLQISKKAVVLYERPE